MVAGIRTSLQSLLVQWLGGLFSKAQRKSIDFLPIPFFYFQVKKKVSFP
jgi:hypothetical protein